MNKFADFLNQKFLEYQNGLKKPAKMKEFAAFLGIPPTSYSNWINSGSIPSMEYTRKLAEKLGDEVYDVLGYARPGRQIAVGNIPQEYIDKLQSWLDDVNSAMGAVDPNSELGRKIIKSSMDKFGINLGSNKKT